MSECQRLSLEILRNCIENIISSIGYGFQESVYQNGLCYELEKHNHKVEKEVTIRVMHEGHELGTIRADIVVDDEYIIEMKVKGKIKIETEVQLDKYMRLLGKKKGFIINIGLTDYEIKEVIRP
jgi:GxxExxY protein